MNSFFVLFSEFQFDTITIYFDAQIPFFLASESHFKLPSLSLDMTPLYFELFLAIWHKMFQVHLVLSLSHSWNQSFLKGALIQLSGGYLEKIC